MNIPETMLAETGKPLSQVRDEVRAFIVSNQCPPSVHDEGWAWAENAIRYVHDAVVCREDAPGNNCDDERPLDGLLDGVFGEGFYEDALADAENYRQEDEG